jgi:hypothetical protein
LLLPSFRVVATEEQAAGVSKQAGFIAIGASRRRKYRRSVGR